MTVSARAYARIGLLGNPSDGFYGKTIAFTIDNFWTEVSLVEWDKLEIVPHRDYDSREYNSLSDLANHADRYGYYGGLRLLTATCRVFYRACKDHCWQLSDKNFMAMYKTNIPRQVGLGGSSAIIVAMWRALRRFYELEMKMFPLAEQASYIWSVERDELGIVSGPMDRVAQIYDSLVYMDFEKSYMEAKGYGRYEVMDAILLPSMFIAWTHEQARESGRIHNPIHDRFSAGDTQVIDAMTQFAQIAKDGKQVIQEQSYSGMVQMYNALGHFISDNFRLRCKLYGLDSIGEHNIAMVDIAAEYGCAAKLTGSGGAIVGLYPDSETYNKLRVAYESKGYSIQKVIPRCQ